MTEGIYLKALVAMLREHTAEIGGAADLAGDPEHAIELLSAGRPRGFRAVVGWEGDESADNDARGVSGAYNCNFYVVVQCPKGLAAKQGEAQADERPGGQRGAMNLMNRVRALVMAFRVNLPSGQAHPQVDDCGPGFTGAEWLDFEDGDERQTVQVRLGFRILLAHDFAGDITD